MIDTAIAIPIFVALEKLARLALRHHDTRTLDAINVRLHDVHMKFVPRGGKLFISQPDLLASYWVGPLTGFSKADPVVEGWPEAMVEAMRQGDAIADLDHSHIGLWDADQCELRAIYFDGKLFTP